MLIRPMMYNLVVAFRRAIETASVNHKWWAQVKRCPAPEPSRFSYRIWRGERLTELRALRTEINQTYSFIKRNRQRRCGRFSQRGEYYLSVLYKKMLQGLSWLIRMWHSPQLFPQIVYPDSSRMHCHINSRERPWQQTCSLVLHIN